MKPCSIDHAHKIKMATCAGGLSEESLKKAKTELNEDPETRQSAIEALRLKISERECNKKLY